MNVIWKTLFASLALAGVPAILSAQESAAIPTGENIVLKNFPETNTPEAVYKNVEKIYTFDANGNCEFRQKTELRVNTLFAMNELCGETFIVYNPKFQRVKINAAYTITADGMTRVDVPENAFNTVLPRCAADAPAFNFLRELVITHTALEPGATIFLDYSVFFDASSGILFDEYADMPFPCERLVMNFNGSTTELFNVPARSREKYFTAEKSVPVIYPGMPAASPRDFSSTENLRLGDAAKPIIASQIHAGMSEGEKRFALVRFVREQIATIPIPSDLLAENDLREPEAVLKSAYGTPLEKARLLWAILSENFDENFKIVRSPADDKYFVETDSGERIALAAEENVLAKIDFKAHCKVLAGKEIIRGNTTFAGANVFEDAKKTAGNLLPAELKIAEAEWLSENLLLIQSEREFAPQDETWLWCVPVAKRGIAAADFETLPQKRKSELKIPVAGTDFSESYVYKIQVPEGWVCAETSRLSELKNAVGSVRFEVKKDGAEIGVDKHLSLEKTTILPSEYSEFRALMRAWFAPENNRLLFIKKEPAPALPAKSE